MLFELWQELGEDFVVVAEKPHELWEADDVEPVHGELSVEHERVERPECLLLAEIHQQNSSHRGHSLAVAQLAVVAAVGREHVEELLLLRAVALTKVFMVSETSSEIKSQGRARECVALTCLLMSLSIWRMSVE